MTQIIEVQICVAVMYLLYFRQVCKMIPGATVVEEQDQDVPYFYKGDQWVSYDNKWSIKKKVQMLLKVASSVYSAL